MKAIPFRRDEVARGDLLCLTRDQTCRVLFKFVGPDGLVVASWLERPEGRPQDVILSQREVMRLVAA